MAFNNVIINKGEGGLGRPLPGTDFISGLLFYSASLPTGFSSGSRIKTVFSVEDAEALGILDTHVGETASTATYLVTTKFTTGDSFKLTCATIASTSPIQADATAGTVTLLDYTADATAATNTTTSATAIAAAINALTYIHGFTATSNTATVTITAAPGQGLFLNTGTPYVKTETGAIAGTLTQNVVAGVPSEIDIMHYHVSEYFRLQPSGKLYIGIYATADATTFDSITLMQNFAVGEIKQLGVYQKTTAFALSQLTTIQSKLTALEALSLPIWSVIYGAEISGTADLTGYANNLHTLTAPQVSVTFAQDGAATGFTLFKATGKSISNVGEALGAVSLSPVNESIAFLKRYQVATYELDYSAFSNGQLWTALSDGARVNLDTLGYWVLRKIVGLGGTYHNRPYTAVSQTSDFAYVPNNRVMFKAIQNVRAFLLPETGGNVTVNADGTLTNDVIGYFKGIGQNALDPMLNDNEISGYQILIDPSQDVASTNNLTVTVKIQPRPTADFITVNIGFTLTLS